MNIYHETQKNPTNKPWVYSDIRHVFTNTSFILFCHRMQFCRCFNNICFCLNTSRSNHSSPIRETLDCPPKEAVESTIKTMSPFPRLRFTSVCLSCSVAWYSNSPGGNTGPLFNVRRWFGFKRSGSSGSCETLVSGGSFNIATASH